ncbi:heterokaryon incompatibility protein-domain-containing protein [Echria macrotheca]|uniref:Heterokaryon incompatibility protein-domain-containing protein n=1 Tax=Echria macrotheca TaxID=438768 RepID=A0AAJ0F829_9PEZI|nr:heterokaryon incompatibility protein-domain-containing protein [Echria macrotheca]
MASDAGFAYDAPLQGNEIRLIEIRTDPKNTLEIELARHRLESVRYEALSYVWGNQTSKEQIKCNGRLMHIGSNLLEALSEQARRQPTALLWADAICINQNDDNEKTSQVRMMRDIYDNSHQVIIWLGKEQQPGDREGFELAERLYQKCDGATYNMSATTYDFHDFDCESNGVPKASYCDPDWTALFNILSHPWFSRIWVVQELLVAKTSIMRRGSLDLDTRIILWNTLHIARHRNLYEAFNAFKGSPASSALMARNIATGYFEYKRAGRLPIYDTLSRYNGMGATDPRDRYFALAGISADLDARFVSYQKTFRDIACLVGKMTLLGAPRYQVEPGGVEVLVFERKPQDHGFPIDWLAFHANPQNHNLGLPSWVPDLISPHSPGLLMSGFYNTRYLADDRRRLLPKLRLRHGVSKWAGSSPSQLIIPVPDEIEIVGAAFDRVETLARERPVLPDESQEERRQRTQDGVGIDPLRAIEAVSQYEAEMVFWLSEIRMLADPTLRPSDSIMSGASFEAFWRTLTYNRGPEFNYQSPNEEPADWLGISFGYWYLLKKVLMKMRSAQDLLQLAGFYQILAAFADPFDKAEGRVRDARRFFVSQNGKFGWVPLRARVGDRVCVFRGMRIPVIMRPRGDRWEFIGACYVHGLMDGEIWGLDGLEWRFMSFL